MDTTMLLCDYAEAFRGKLYIMGGGWTMCPPGLRSMVLAIRIMVPWSETNERHKMVLTLLDDSGRPAELAEPGQLTRQEDVFEVGRPPGLPSGTEIEYTAVLGFSGLPLAPKSSYRWQLEINGEPIAGTSFRTTGGQSRQEGEV